MVDLPDPHVFKRNESQSMLNTRATIGKRYDFLDPESRIRVPFHETGQILQDEIFIDASDDFRCPICSQVYKEPVTDNCDNKKHSFCFKCLQKAFASKRECPISRRHMHITNLELLRDKDLNEKVKSLKCKCYYPGCPWNGKYFELDKHLEACQCLFYRCGICQDGIQRDEIQEHVAICPFQRIRCKMCRWEGPMERKLAHDNACPEWPIMCEKGCKMFIPRKNFQTHVNQECPMILVSCSFEKLGCKVQVTKFIYLLQLKQFPRVGRGSHYQSCQQRHLELIYQALTQLLNDIERRSVNERVNDHNETPVISKLGKAVMSLQEKFYLLSDEIAKAKILAGDALEEGNVHANEQTNSFDYENDYKSMVLSLQNYFSNLSQLLNRETAEKRDLKKEKDFLDEQLLNFTNRLSIAEKQLKDKDDIIIELKKELNQRGTTLMTDKKGFSDLFPKMVNIEDNTHQETQNKEGEIRRLEDIMLENDNKVNTNKEHLKSSKNKQNCKCNIF